jgi:hypothetical protein
MKKRISISLCITVIVLNSCKITEYTHKTPINDIGFGISNYRNIMDKSINIEPTVSISYYNIYFDLSNNLKFGKGTEYSMVSNINKKLDKINLGAINIGYNIKLTNRKFLIPTIGYAWAIKIYSDDNYNNAYYRQLSKTNLNIGIKYKMFFKKYNKFGLMIGTSIIERINVSIIRKI